jgi:hypothetical protein
MTTRYVGQIDYGGDLYRHLGPHGRRLQRQARPISTTLSSTSSGCRPISRAISRIGISQRSKSPNSASSSADHSLRPVLCGRSAPLPISRAPRRPRRGGLTRSRPGPFSAYPAIHAARLGRETGVSAPCPPARLGSEPQPHRAGLRDQRAG